MSRATPRRYAWVFPGACLFALAVLFGAYSNSFQNSFHFDDDNVIERNLYIRNLENIPRFFRDATTYSVFPPNAAYRPLVSTTLAVDYWIGGGLDVRQFHRSQFAMLALLGVLLFFVLLRLLDFAEAHWWNRYVALLAAALYSVHTSHTETMNIIQVRSELLSTLGVVGSFLVYFYLPRSRRAHLYLVPMVVGSFAKPTTVMFAPIFFVYLLLFEQRLSASDLFTWRSWPSVRSAIWKSAPAFAVAVVAFAFTNAKNAPTFELPPYGRWEYFLTQCFAWLHYGRLFFLPIGLTADTDWGLITKWYDTRVVAGLGFAVLLLRVLWVSSRQASMRPIAFGIAWFGLALLPTSTIIPLGEVTNDHRPFFPYIGLCLAVVWGLVLAAQRLYEKHPTMRTAIAPAAFTVAFLAVFGNAVGTYERNETFRSEETLWRDVTEKSPANGRGLMNYGLALMRVGRFTEANDLFERAKVYTPNYDALEVNLAIVTDRLGQPEAAEGHFQRAVQLKPDVPSTHSFYGSWLLTRGRLDEAILQLARAVALAPADPSPRYQLLDAYARAGRTSELKALAVETLALLPGDPQAQRYLNDRGEVVVPVSVQVGTSAPHTAEGLLNESLHRYQAQDFQGSLEAARKAIELRPDYAEAYNNIAAAFASMQRWDEAIEAARTAVRLKPDYQLAKNNLAWAESEKRKANPESK